MTNVMIWITHNISFLWTLVAHRYRPGYKYSNQNKFKNNPKLVIANSNNFKHILFIILFNHISCFFGHHYDSRIGICIRYYRHSACVYHSQSSHAMYTKPTV